MSDFFHLLGSGLMMSVAYLDPGNLEANIQAGVQSGFRLLWWFALCSLVFGYTFQAMAARLGVVTGQDLAKHCGEEYPRTARVLLWLMMEIAIIGADIQETIGSSIALHILSGEVISLWAGCLIISVSAFILLLLERFGLKQLEAVFAVFIALMGVSLGINFFQAHIPAKKVLTGLLVPTIPRDAWPVAVGALGALVMPYNIYFHSSLVSLKKPNGEAEQHDDHKRTRLFLHNMESIAMLAVAFIINLFVVCVFAQAFYGTEEVMGLETAGKHLGESYGVAFKYMWAVGLLASGQVGTIGLTYAGQLIMTGMLRLEVLAWQRMVATRLCALVPTLLLAVVFEASHKFDLVAHILNIVQSLQIPFALIPVMHMTSNKAIMGPSFCSGQGLRVFTHCMLLCVMGVNFYMLMGFMATDLPRQPWAIMCFVLLAGGYYSLVLYFFLGPLLWSQVVNNTKDKAKYIRKMLAASSARYMRLSGEEVEDKAEVLVSSPTAPTCPARDRGTSSAGLGTTHV